MVRTCDRIDTADRAARTVVTYIEVVMDEAIAVEPLRQNDPAGFDALWRIYEESITGSERKGRAALRRMLDRPEYRFLVARKDVGICGFAVVYRSPAEPFELLEYLAVGTELRGRGVGGRLFGATAAELGDRALLVEVDSPRADSPDFHACTLRERFYRRLGCLRVDGVTYILPLPGAPPAMDLMLYRRRPAPSIACDELRRWIEEVFDRVYARPRDDARIEEMLSGVPELIRLR